MLGGIDKVDAPLELIERLRSHQILVYWRSVQSCQ